MSNSSKDAAPKPASESPSKDSSAAGGRIVHDSRGNAVWNWDKGGDSSSTATTSKMLRKLLDVPSLRVEGEAPTPEAEEPTATSKKKRPSGYGPGYNPYDRAAPVKPAPAQATPSRSLKK